MLSDDELIAAFYDDDPDVPEVPVDDDPDVPGISVDLSASFKAMMRRENRSAVLQLMNNALFLKQTELMLIAFRRADKEERGIALDILQSHSFRRHGLPSPSSISPLNERAAHLANEYNKYRFAFGVEFSAKNPPRFGRELILNKSSQSWTLSKQTCPPTPCNTHSTTETPIATTLAPFAAAQLPELVQKLINDGRASFIDVDSPGVPTLLDDIEAIAYRPDGVVFIRHRSIISYVFCLIGPRMSKGDQRKVLSALTALQREQVHIQPGGAVNAIRLQRLFQWDFVKGKTPKELAHDLVLPSGGTIARMNTMCSFLADLEQEADRLWPPSRARRSRNESKSGESGQKSPHKKKLTENPNESHTSPSDGPLEDERVSSTRGGLVSESESADREYREAWADLLKRYQWQWFVTLTSKPDIQLNRLKRQFDQWIKDLQASAGEPSAFGWVYTVEQRRHSGDWHIHGLIGGLQLHVQRRTWSGRWRGYADIRTFDPTRGGIEYILKNVTHSNNTPEVGGPGFPLPRDAMKGGSPRAIVRSRSA